MHMESHLSETALWANGLAARLKVLQANLADDDAATREGLIVDEINRALKGCVPEKRKLLLDALAEQFPSWQSSIPGRRPPAAAAPVSFPSEPETPEALLKRLIESGFPGLSAGQREEFTRQLKQAGLELPRRRRWRHGVRDARICRSGSALPAPKPAQCGARREDRWLRSLDMVLTMDQLVWTLWKQLASQICYPCAGS